MPYPLPTDSPLPTFAWMRRLALPLFLLFIVSVHLHLQPLHRDIIKPRIGSSFFHLPASCFPYLSSPTPSPAPPPPDGFPFISPSAFVPLPWFLILLRHQRHPPLLYRFIQVLRWIFFFWNLKKVDWKFRLSLLRWKFYDFWDESFVILRWKFKFSIKNIFRWKFQILN